MCYIINSDTKGDIMEKDNKKVKSEVELNIDKRIQNDFKNRDNLFKSVEEDLQIHTRNLMAYGRIEKEYKLLKVKYQSLENEYRKLESLYGVEYRKLKNNMENLQVENRLLKKVVINDKRKISGLKSIVELVVNDYGIQNIELVTGLSSDKIKEYLT